MPRITPQTLKSTFYLYKTVEDANNGANFGGTGFFVGKTLEGDPSRAAMFAVTNWHVIKECPVIRLNRHDGKSQAIDVLQDQWIFDPKGHDIAVTPLVPDQTVFDINMIMMEMFATSDQIARHSIGPGENVYMAGRFIDAAGGPTNQPAARFGNISLMPIPLWQQVNQKTRPNYCIDIHSRSGFSGSPVFVYRKPGDDLTTGNLNIADQFFLLLGIHYAQFQELWEVKRTKRQKGNNEARIGTDATHVEGLIRVWRPQMPS